MDSESSILRAAKSFFAGTLLSRVMGMLRDVSMAFCFGSAPEVAAFMVSYRLANLFRRLLGEGGVQGGFVPHFEKLRVQGERQAALFYRDLFFSLAAVLVAAMAAGVFACWGLASFLESDIPLMMLAMLPGTAFLCFYAIDSSVHQCNRRYFLPAFAPVLFNLIWIAAAFFLQTMQVRFAMFGLSISLMAAFFLQWMAVSRSVVGWARGVLGKEVFAPRPFSGEVRSLFNPLVFGLLGTGAAQINSALDAVFARLADPSGPAYLWYAIRIQQLPLALFGIALSGALLPALSRAPSMERFQQLLGSGLKKGAALMVPCAVGMIVLGYAGLDLLYGRGDFHATDVFQTGLCLSGYALGLVPMVYVLLLSNGFYALKEYAWPMRCSLAAVACNLVLNSLFVFAFKMGAESVALATSLSSFLNCALLGFGMKRRVGGFGLWRGVWRMSIASLLAAFLTNLLDSGVVHLNGFGSQLLRFAVSGSAFGLSVIGLAFLLRANEFFEIFRPVREQGGER